MMAGLAQPLLRKWLEELGSPLEAGVVAALIAFPVTLALQERVKSVREIVQGEGLLILAIGVVFCVSFFFVTLVEAVAVAFIYLVVRREGLSIVLLTFAMALGVWFYFLLDSAGSLGAYFTFVFMFSFLWPVGGVWFCSDWNSWRDQGELLALDLYVVAAVAATIVAGTLISAGL